MEPIEIPVSVGELVDKVTILQIKSVKISDPSKLKNITKELQALERICRKASIDLDLKEVRELHDINSKLWVIEDDLRDLERQKDFGDQFVQLARSVYITNDSRFRAKALLNEKYGSQFHEEKSYKKYL